MEEHDRWEKWERRLHRVALLYMHIGMLPFLAFLVAGAVTLCFFSVATNQTALAQAGPQLHKALAGNVGVAYLTSPVMVIGSMFWLVGVIVMLIVPLLKGREEKA